MAPPTQPGEWQVTLLGSGSSSGVPKLGCLLTKKQTCICNQSPFSPQNRRGNPSILLRKVYHHPQKGGKKDFTILIDCGKTFREACATHLPSLGVERVDCVILTHEHADASGGLDDLREVQERGSSLPLYADAITHARVRACFPYILSTPTPIPIATSEEGKQEKGEEGGGGGGGGGSPPKPRLWTANCTPLLFQPFQPFLVEGLEITPIPLHHGPNLCNGFLFNQLGGPSQMAYFSDFRCLGEGEGDKKGKGWVVVGPQPLPEESVASLSCFVDMERTTKLLKRKPLSLAFLDCISFSSHHISHSNLTETVGVIRGLEGKGVEVGRFLLLGMACSIDYHVVEPDLEKKFPGRRVSLCYDGLTLPSF